MKQVPSQKRKADVATLASQPQHNSSTQEHTGDRTDATNLTTAKLEWMEYVNINGGRLPKLSLRICFLWVTKYVGLSKSGKTFDETGRMIVFVGQRLAARDLGVTRQAIQQAQKPIVELGFAKCVNKGGSGAGSYIEFEMIKGKDAIALKGKEKHEIRASRHENKSKDVLARIPLRNSVRNSVLINSTGAPPEAAAPEREGGLEAGSDGQLNDADACFQEFLDTYPKEDENLEATKHAWDKHVVNADVDPYEVIDGAKRWSDYDAGGGKAFIPYPGKFLSDRWWLKPCPSSSAKKQKKKQKSPDKLSKAVPDEPPELEPKELGEKVLDDRKVTELGKEAFADDAIDDVTEAAVENFDKDDAPAVARVMMLLYRGRASEAKRRLVERCKNMTDFGNEIVAAINHSNGYLSTVDCRAVLDYLTERANGLKQKSRDVDYDDN